MKSRIRMRGGSPAYDHHVAEGFLNQPSTYLSNMPLTQLESGPVENYGNLYQISGGGRRSSGRRRSGRRRSGSRSSGRRRSSRPASKRNTRKRTNSSRKNRRSRPRSKRCGCQRLNKK